MSDLRNHELNGRNAQIAVIQRTDRIDPTHRDNKIDADVLPQLTADDLKDIGVSAVGDRRRLLAAIAALSDQSPSVNALASPLQPAPAGGLQISAERRPIR